MKCWLKFFWCLTLRITHQTLNIESIFIYAEIRSRRRSTWHQSWIDIALSTLIQRWNWVDTKNSFALTLWRLRNYKSSFFTTIKQNNSVNQVDEVLLWGDAFRISFFWSVFSCFRTAYRKTRTRKNVVSGHFSSSERSYVESNDFKGFHPRIDNLAPTTEGKMTAWYIWAVYSKIRQPK